MPPKWATFVNRNQENVGATAAEYFLSRGYRNFAFVGTPLIKAAEWCERRLDGFRSRLKKEGLDSTAFNASTREVSSDFDMENVIGTNAGIVWRAMTSDRSWTYEELKEETGLSDKELWTAIGWLARENQIEFDSSAEEERIYLNRSYF